jgi:hypothetical protein
MSQEGRKYDNFKKLDGDHAEKRITHIPIEILAVLNKKPKLFLMSVTVVNDRHHGAI